MSGKSTQQEEADFKNCLPTANDCSSTNWVDDLRILDPKEYQQLKWVYYDAKYRCTNEKHLRYPDYGGRGIEFKLESIDSWLLAMGPRPKDFEMDRIDNNGPYEVGNLHWVDSSTQQKNKRIYHTNTSGIKGVNYVSTLQKWTARCNNNKNGKRDYLYVGKDFFEACCARLSWESMQSS